MWLGAVLLLVLLASSGCAGLGTTESSVRFTNLTPAAPLTIDALRAATGPSPEWSNFTDAGDSNRSPTAGHIGWPIEAT